jgi:DNA-binding beta-propeller fold protein YncE
VVGERCGRHRPTQFAGPSLLISLYLEINARRIPVLVTGFGFGDTGAVDGATVTNQNGRARTMRLTVACLLVWALADAVAAPTAGEPAGSLRQLAGGAGCLESSGVFTSCRNVLNLETPAGIAVAPDGRHVYVGSESSSVVAFRRGRKTGALRRLPGKLGCIRWRGGRGCSAARAFSWPRAIAISSDGRTVYVGADQSGAVAVLSRDRATGRLRQLPGRAGCVGNAPGAGCTYIRRLVNVDGLALSPDGHTLYSWGEDVTVLVRRGRRLVRPSRRRTCVGAAGGGCTAKVLAVSPDGRHVYAASPYEGGSGATTGGIVKGFRRRSDGTLVQLPGVAGCLAQRYPPGAEEGCGSAVGIGFPTALALGRGGRTVYVAGGHGSAIAIFRRDPVSGALVQAHGEEGCVSWRGRGECAPARGIAGPQDVAVTPDGRNLYVASQGSSAVAIFSTVGGLRQLPGRRGCIKVEGGERCRPGRGLSFADEVAVSRDGLNVYAGANLGTAGQGRLAIFKRTTASR